MSEFARRIHSSVEFELEPAQRAKRQGASDIALRHHERTHVLGLTATFEHVRVHCPMLGWARRQRKVAEAVGQVRRIAGAALA